MDNESREKRIYSLNLICYITTVTNLPYSLYLDEVDNKKAYAVFPECEAVSAAIRQYNYNHPIPVLEYVNNFKTLREKIRQIKGTV